MANDLIPDPSVLDGFPGGPFTEGEVDAAVGALRAYCRWHIAPVRVDLAVLDIEHGQRVLILPTLELVSVDEIRNADPSTVVDPATYKVSHRTGLVRGYWSRGFEAIEVDFTHGHAECPPELLPLVGELSQATRVGGPVGTSIKLGDLSISGTSADLGVDPASAALIAAVDQYRLMAGFA